MPATHRIIIDTDPGQDDAVAILLALASPELEVLGITAVAGNVPLALTEKNARKICELAGKPDMPVYAGAVRPLVRRRTRTKSYHDSLNRNCSGASPATTSACARWPCRGCCWPRPRPCPRWVAPRHCP